MSSSAKPKRLIVTADDVGLDDGMLLGTLQAHHQGIVTACSVVANGVAFDSAAESLRSTPKLEVGVHLTLVEERALTTGETMPRNYVQFGRAYFAKQLRLGWIESELRAQVRRVIDTGLTVTHLNGHQHLHALPGVFAIAVRLAEEFGIPYVRVPRDAKIKGAPVRVASVAVLAAFAKRSARALNGRSVYANHATTGITEAGHLDTPTLLRLIAQLPDGTTELVTHPGLGVRRYPHWEYQWERETAALCDPEVHAALADAGVELTTPSAEAASR